jgi:hypothetical protein
VAGRSFRDVLQRQQEAGFVARDSELAQFRVNLALSEGERRLIFCVHGDGGVGKTFLLMRMRSIADELDIATGWVDETVSGAPEAMQRITSDLSRYHEDMGSITKTLNIYYRRRLKVEADPHAPEGTSAFLTQMAIYTGLHAAHLVPGVGGLVDYIDSAALADRLGPFVAGKFRRPEDARILLSPLDVLTPVFVRDLTRAGRRRPIVLFFDSYEKIGPLLDGWLRSMLTGRYGELPQDLVIMIAGRHPLDLHNWGKYGLVADMPLAPFSEAETRQLLTSKDVTNEQVVQTILEVSGGLPLLVATLAQNQPTNPGQIGDPSGDAVEVFLKWERDPVRRALAVAAAAPRVLNEDIIGALVGDSAWQEADQSELFAWLRSQAFVTPEPGRHEAGRSVYHEVVRTRMIRLGRSRSEPRWRKRHRVLAQAFRRCRLEVSREDAWDDPAWRDHKLEETYHLMCANLVKALPDALSEIADACAHHAATAVLWAEMIVQAGRDSGSAQIRTWGQRLEEALLGNDDEAAAARMAALIREGRMPGSRTTGRSPDPRYP